MNADSQLRPDSQRLQSLRRARAGAGLAAEPTKEDAENRSPWQKLALHPVALLVLGGLVGLASGLATSFYSAQRELDQYWREERITTYQEYHAAYEAVYSLTNNPVSDIVYSDDSVSPKTYVTKEQVEQAEKAMELVDEKKKRFDLVASDRMTKFVDSGYYAQYNAILVLRDIEAAKPDEADSLREHMKYRTEQDKFFEEPVWPETFLSEAKKDLGTT